MSVASVSLVVNGLREDACGHVIKKIEGETTGIEFAEPSVVPKRIHMALDSCLEAMHELAEWVGDNRPDGAAEMKAKIVAAHTPVVALRKALGF